MSLSVTWNYDGLNLRDLPGQWFSHKLSDDPGIFYGFQALIGLPSVNHFLARPVQEFTQDQTAFVRHVCELDPRAQAISTADHDSLCPDSHLVNPDSDDEFS